jgi:hypothetical protein
MRSESEKSPDGTVITLPIALISGLMNLHTLCWLMILNLSFPVSNSHLTALGLFPDLCACFS